MYLLLVKNFLFFKYSLKTGITDPLDPATFPYLTTENLTLPFFADILFDETKILSDVSFVAPYKLIGSDALSVDKAITFVTLFSILALTTFSAPPIFVLIHS